jgi:hypothetical protein
VREVARRRILDELSKPVEGKEAMPTRRKHVAGSARL